MMSWQKRIIFFIISFQVFLLSSFASEEKSQTKAILKLNEAPISLATWLDPTAYSGLGSTALAYLARDMEPKLFKAGFKEVFIKNTEDKRVTRMFIKMEGTPHKKRPFIVFVGGLSSAASSEVFQNYAIPLNKYFGYSVAILENASSSSWSLRNKTLISNGDEAGFDLYQKIKALRYSKDVDPYVSEMHVVGLSLGGSDASFMAYFDSVLKEGKNGGTIVDGAILNWSSPADRYKSYKELRTLRGIAGLIVDSMFKSCYEKTKDIYAQYTDKDYHWIFWNSSLEEVLEEVYMKTTSSKSVESYKELFNLENYLPYIEIPILWISSNNDPVVLHKTTSDFVIKNKSKIFDIYPKNFGGHVGQAHAYGGVWVLETMVNYFKYWGRFHSKYYTQWKKDYQLDYIYHRYLRENA